MHTRKKRSAKSSPNVLFGLPRLPISAMVGTLCLLNCLISISSSTAQEFISERTDSLIKLGIRLTIQQTYSKAIRVCHLIKQEIPDSPIGYFLHAAALQTRMMDYENYDTQESFLALIDTAIALSERQIKQNPRSAWPQYFLGTSYGYLSFFKSKQKKYIEAWRYGQRTIKALEAAHRLDDKLYDVYFGIGSYEYFVGKLGRLVSWLPFVRDRRTNGFEMIKIAMSKGTYSKYSAMNGLCWISLDENRLDEGMQIAVAALEEFPKSRAFLWCAAKLAVKMGNLKDGASYYTRILQSLQDEGVRSPYNELVCRKNLCKIYAERGELAKAQQECEMISTWLADDNVSKRFAKAAKEARIACNQLEKRIAPKRSDISLRNR